MVKDLKAVFRKFNTEDKCRAFLVQQRWNGKPVCPHCGHEKVYVTDKGRGFKCASPACYKKFTVMVGTVFQSSNIPLTTWLPAVYIIHSHKKGISSVQLAKDLGVTQKTAWFMLHRIREFMKENNPQMIGGEGSVIESDETYMSRKYASDYIGAPPQLVQHNKSSHLNKGAVLGLADRQTGKIRVKAFYGINSGVLKAEINTQVIPGSEIHTDDSNMYRKILDNYSHKAVSHIRREWVVNGVTTNHVEMFWAVMKRGVYGIYHQISYKHLQAYCNEFSYRYNSRKITDGERFVNSLTHIEGRLTYKQLVHGKNSQEGQEANQEKGE